MHEAAKRNATIFDDDAEVDGYISIWMVANKQMRSERTIKGQGNDSGMKMQNVR